MNKTKKLLTVLIVAVFMTGFFAGCSSSTSTNEKNQKGKTIVNVSYDPTRELYERYNPLFQAYYKNKTGKDIQIIQSHGGSDGQARSVVEGNRADVVTLALARNVSFIEKIGIINPGWENEFPNDSSPYTSTIVFLVRKGNPKNIKDWDDLTKAGVNVITPDPKTSGGACWNFLAAWAYGEKKFNHDEEKTKDFVASIYKNVSVMDSGARGATTTFVENGQGDVLIAWENEAITSVAEFPDKFELVTPTLSILAQPTVAVVNKDAQRDGVEEESKEYLQYLYSDEAQKIIGESGYRPSNPEILKQFAKNFNLKMNLVTVNDFGGWNKAYTKFFEEDKIFDQIMEQINT